MIPKDLGTPYRDLVTTIPLAVVEELLDHHNHNNYRRLIEREVEKKRKLMQDGLWQPSACVVRLDPKDEVLDGQHSLTAARLERKPLKCILVRQTPSEAMLAYDTGMRMRSVADHLRREGHANPNNVGSVTRMLWRWDNGFVKDSPPIQEHLAYAASIPDIGEVVNLALTLRNRIRMRVPVGGPFIVRSRIIDPESAGLFITKLSRGPGFGGDKVVRGDQSINQLREYMMRQPHARQQRDSVYDLALTVKAWNAWITGRDLKHLAWRSGGAAAEPFPFMIDATNDPYPFPDYKAFTDRQAADSKAKTASKRNRK